jgi:nucleotidyltransferase/DNA polymerase involved in DNA repair
MMLHVDMDPSYASLERGDRPERAGSPAIVGDDGGNDD